MVLQLNLKYNGTRFCICFMNEALEKGNQHVLYVILLYNNLMSVRLSALNVLDFSCVFSRFSTPSSIPLWGLEKDP